MPAFRPFHAWITLLAGLAFMGNGLDLSVVSFSLTGMRAELGLSASEISYILPMAGIGQLVGAFAFGYVQDMVGHVRAMTATLIGWILMIALAYFAEGPAMFWVAANLAGLCMGSSQAAGRAIVGYLSPPARNAEFFGLWGLAVKTASIFGPLTYGAVTWIFTGDHRLGILAVGVYFVVGLILLSGINIERGRDAALKAS